MRDFNRNMDWQKTDDMTVAICESTRSFPKDEVQSLTSQIRRAAYTFSSNIAKSASRILTGLIRVIEKEGIFLSKAIAKTAAALVLIISL